MRDNDYCSYAEERQILRQYAIVAGRVPDMTKMGIRIKQAAEQAKKHFEKIK